MQAKMQPIVKTTSVTVVDDDVNVRYSVPVLIKSDPSMELAGTEATVAEDFVEVIRRQNPDVVLMDVAFGENARLALGIPAIRQLRRSFGVKLGIVAHTVFHAYKHQCLNAGADAFVLKSSDSPPEIAMALLRKVILNCKKHDAINALEVDSDKLTCRITLIQAGKFVTRMVPLKPNDFAFLYYLAEERARSGADWLKRERSNQSNPPYRFINVAIWRAICERVRAKDAGTWDNSDISSSAFHINSALSANGSDDQTRLIITPGQGQGPSLTEIMGRMYCLNEFVEPAKITFKGLRISSFQQSTRSTANHS